MNRKKSLHTVAKLTHDQERNAARDMGHVRMQMEQHAARLEELEYYKQQYQQQYQAASKQGLGAVQLQEYHVFLARLDTAVDEQRQVLESSRQVYEERRQHWLGLRGNAKSLDKIISRRQLQLIAEQNRREQAECDDYACQSGYRKSL
ncbi:MAG TPA: flagellar export protein FliJ [Chromatiaceae bacterium]|nr:flagellar export protein FliJ [Chromatiaceae bacterium]